MPVSGGIRSAIMGALQGRDMPRPARNSRTAKAIVKTVNAPELSFRGAKRRGNLAVPGRIIGYFRQKRNCLPEIAPQGHFLALRAQGATSAVGLLAMTHQGGAVVHQSTSAVELPCTRRSLSAATDAIGACHCIDTQRESPVQRRARHAAHPQRAIDVPPVFHHQFPGIIPLAGAYI